MRKSNSNLNAEIIQKIQFPTISDMFPAIYMNGWVTLSLGNFDKVNFHSLKPWKESGKLVFTCLF